MEIWPIDEPSDPTAILWLRFYRPPASCRRLNIKETPYPAIKIYSSGRFDNTKKGATIFKTSAKQLVRLPETTSCALLYASASVRLQKKCFDERSFWASNLIQFKFSKRASFKWLIISSKSINFLLIVDNNKVVLHLQKFLVKGKPYFHCSCSQLEETIVLEQSGTIRSRNYCRVPNVKKGNLRERKHLKNKQYKFLL